MTHILDIIRHPWLDIMAALGTFSLAPGIMLRLLVRLYPKGSARRRELVAELGVVPRWERPFWVAEQLMMIVTEGWSDRAVARRDRRAREADDLRKITYSFSLRRGLLRTERFTDHNIFGYKDHPVGFRRSEPVSSTTALSAMIHDLLQRAARITLDRFFR
jgi:hypothetical protein